MTINLFKDTVTIMISPTVTFTLNTTYNLVPLCPFPPVYNLYMSLPALQAAECNRHRKLVQCSSRSQIQARPSYTF